MEAELTTKKIDLRGAIKGKSLYDAPGVHGIGPIKSLKITPIWTVNETVG